MYLLTHCEPAINALDFFLAFFLNCDFFIFDFKFLIFQLRFYFRLGILRSKKILKFSFPFCRLQIYRIYLCITRRPFVALKEAPKITLNLYTGQRFRAKFQLNNSFKKHNNVVLGITNAVEKVGFSSSD